MNATNSRTQQAATTVAKTKELSDGARIGRALTKLQAINDAEVAELATLPEEIKARHAKKRESLLAELEPGIKTAVLAAATAMAPKAVAAE